ncbi:MAG: PQQ-dependent sugar dehydrogenase [Candidatus Limnocylindria bacterium]
MPRPARLILYVPLAVAIGILLALLIRAGLGRLAGVNPDAGLGGRAELAVPDGYRVSVFAEGLSAPRFMAVSPAGVLFVAERGADRVVALPDADANGVADTLFEVGRGYKSAHSLAFANDGTLLVAGTTTLFRVTLGEDLAERERAVVVGGLPGGGHATKTVAVRPNGTLLLSIGSSCDVCQESDSRRAAISLVTAGGELRPYMTGLRNAVGLWIDPVTARAWATNMGRDWLGADAPPETLYEVIDGADAGWPRCHAGSIVDPDFGGADACAGVAQPAATFGAHMAPLALVEWDGHMVIAFHGSWNSADKVGYALWWLPWDGAPAGEAVPFATGFLPPGAQDARGRPAGLAVGADGALYVSDDKAGFIYRIAADAGGG